MTVRLPTRYEDLLDEYRSKLRPDVSLLDQVKAAFQSMTVTGGLRFLPVYGLSGCGKTSAAFELSTHLPDVETVAFPRECIDDVSLLRPYLVANVQDDTPTVLIVDQYEEVAAGKTDIPSRFIESLSLIDRDPEFRSKRMLFIWLTTASTFRDALVTSTSRNRRILHADNYQLVGPRKEDWSSIIEDTFQFHNTGRTLSDCEIIDTDLSDTTSECDTIGAAVHSIAERLSKYVSAPHDISQYCVAILWPVTDGLRITRVSQFADPRAGYMLDWNAFYRQLNADDQSQLPLKDYNKTRLYFDFRLIPIAAADIEPFCRDLDKDPQPFYSSHIDRLKGTHLVQVVNGTFEPARYAPMRERDSERARKARSWYNGATDKSVQIGKRLSLAFREMGLAAEHEKDIITPHSKVRTDVYVEYGTRKYCIELKCYSDANTRPSSIIDAIKGTFRKYAQLAGFVQRQ